MLVVTRRVGEEIVIGGKTFVRVLEVNGHVKLGIRAPNDVVIDRREVHERIRNGEHRRDLRS